MTEKAQPTGRLSPVGRSIAAAMARHEITQRDVAEITGSSQTQVSCKLAGQSNFTDSDIRRLSERLAVPVADLVPDDLQPRMPRLSVANVAALSIVLGIPMGRLIWQLGETDRLAS
jgi:transcriptional regulator with XRE-family HTH domain